MCHAGRWQYCYRRGRLNYLERVVIEERTGIMNRREFSETLAAAPLALAAVVALDAKGQPMSLLLDASDEEQVAARADEWRRVATATMEAEVIQISGLAPRVGDEVEFTTPIMSAMGTVTEIHNIADINSLAFLLLEASVYKIHINTDTESGLKYGPQSCKFTINGIDRHHCHRVNVIETIGGGPRRDSAALALERHELDMARQDIQRREGRVARGNVRHDREVVAREASFVDLDDADECREFIRSLVKPHAVSLTLN